MRKTHHEIGYNMMSGYLHMQTLLVSKEHITVLVLGTEWIPVGYSLKESYCKNSLFHETLIIFLFFNIKNY